MQPLINHYSIVTMPGVVERGVYLSPPVSTVIFYSFFSITLTNTNISYPTCLTYSVCTEHIYLLIRGCNEVVVRDEPGYRTLINSLPYLGTVIKHRLAWWRSADQTDISLPISGVMISAVYMTLIGVKAWM